MKNIIKRILNKLRFAKNNRGFTLIEILIVIGVVATISTVAVLIINPAQTTAQARDARRLAELRSLNSALSLAEVNNIPMGLNATVYVSLPGPSNCADLGLPNLPVGWSYACSNSDNYRKIDGSGWVPVNFDQISYGSPLSVLPVDQINDAVGGFYYTYTIEGGWELNAEMESNAYNAGGAKDVVSNDGGDTDLLYEISSNLTLIPSQINDRSGGGAVSAPSVVTLTASNVATSNATLNGSANPNGTATTGWFRYDTVDPGFCNDVFGTRAPLAGDFSLGSDNAVVNYSQDIANLTMGATYYFCAVAENTAGKVFGSVIPFITSSLPGRYWVGGAGNWDDTAHWSASSGGVGGASVSASTDDVYFDANSFTAAGQIVTINVTANTKNMNWTGVANNPTLAGTSPLNITGSLTLVSGMTRTYTGAITFSSTSIGNTITLAGKTLDGNVIFAGSGGGWILQDNFNIGTRTVTLTRGSLNTNNQSIVCGIFNATGSDTRSLILGSSSITCSSSGTAWNLGTLPNGLSLNAGTSQITLTATSPTFAGGSLIYNNVILNSAGTVTISGTNTFNNLTRNGTAVTTDRLILVSSQTISGTLTLSGNSVTNRLFVLSSAMDAERSFAAAAVSLVNVDFQNIGGMGAASFSGTSLGNALGNSNINFTAAVTRYWVGNGGSWNSAAKWSASSGGVGGASVPLPHDTVIFDASSITSASQNITTNMPRLGADIDFSAVANNPTLGFSSTANTIFGSLTLGANMIISGTQNLTFSPRSAVNLTNNGRTFTNPIYIDTYGGVITMQDAFNSNSSLSLTRGTLTANNQNITVNTFSSSNANVRVINMGSGIWTLKGTGTAWNTYTVTQLTLNINTSMIIINNNTATAKTFAGGGKTYYNFQLTNTGTGVTTISGSNTFNNFTVDTSPKAVSFTANTIQTINGVFTANGSAGALMTFRSTASPTKWTINAASANLSYIDVQDSTAAAPFVCGATCVNSGNNTGWSF